MHRHLAMPNNMNLNNTCLLAKMLKMKKSANKKQMLPAKKMWVNLLLVSAMLLVGLLAIPSMVYAQNKTITGKVTNESGAAVAGATVQVKGASGGTSTDNNGNFSIVAA